MESVNAALKKVADFTDALSSEQAVTASSLKPVLQLITEDLLLPAEEDTQLTYKDIDISDEVKDELMVEMMDLPEEQRNDGDGEDSSAPNPPKKMNLADLLEKKKGRLHRYPREFAWTPR
ncbi:Zinc finger BED domaincontaining protein 1like [Caligus rogercresseyi]|uniref:Zinc finger BED domaincontaining protein 1like n=1 Tax=Caligus rogercresseyi TaxID=217165 RepID=A0A7T8JYD3_CALRO|nr:Zinc finger BED domaincontaining protein 1like [Caligus rogercresseyi]